MVTEKRSGKFLPLFGKRILITRAREQVEEFSCLLRGYGAQVITFPTIEIAPPEDWRPVDQAIERLGGYDWIVFTSVNGVRSFIRRLKETGRSIGVIEGKQICTIGPRTERELERMGLKVTFLPSEYRAEGLAEGLKARGVEGKRILLPRAKGARRVLPQALIEAGGMVDEVETYRVAKPSKSDDSFDEILQKRIDVVAFTSSSTVQGFMELLSERRFLDGVTVAVIGPVTGETARRYGVEPTIVPSEYTIPALAEAIVNYYRGKTSR